MSAVRVCRVDSVLVKMFGIEFAAFYSRDLRAHQCSAIFEILRAMLRPNLELPVVSCRASKWCCLWSEDAESHAAAWESAP